MCEAKTAGPTPAPVTRLHPRRHHPYSYRNACRNAPDAKPEGGGRAEQQGQLVRLQPRARDGDAAGGEGGPDGRPGRHGGVATARRRWRAFRRQAQAAASVAATSAASTRSALAARLPAPAQCSGPAPPQQPLPGRAAMVRCQPANTGHMHSLLSVPRTRTTPPCARHWTRLSQVRPAPLACCLFAVGSPPGGRMQQP